MRNQGLPELQATRRQCYYTVPVLAMKMADQALSRHMTDYRYCVHAHITEGARLANGARSVHINAHAFNTHFCY